ncbi:lytic transglycosylase domain-containing protein [Ideonella livida]|uniref:Lytic transglycosylase domain-containing protein n=1 Tax=Ideonella livida TaxID=2707176 RepID=A0A7C9TMS0_9BURK|nr:lytic transglycosylase domain-containing protein [Ideonella livida]NDY92607.1 lytic transglycosylase domain-containing protein [Ideonella livida]
MFPAARILRLPALICAVRTGSALRPGALLALLLAAPLLALTAPPATAQPAPPAADRDELVPQAREAWGRRDKSRLAALRQQALAQRHPLAPWVDYWDLNLRLGEARADEVEAFFARWPGSYQEDRLRNDWLLELGRRRDWATFAQVHPRFRMNDDREVACYALLAQPTTGQTAAGLREAALKAWMPQREPDDGCQRLAQTLHEAKVLRDADLWRKVRHAVEHNRQRLARNTAEILSPTLAKTLAEVLENPARHLNRKANAFGQGQAELTALALARLAATDTDEAAQRLLKRWDHVIGPERTAWVWSQIAKQAGLALNADALTWADHAWAAARHTPDPARPDWSDETLGWLARVSLRLGTGEARWQGVLRAVDAMGPAERADPTWQYWRARAVAALARPGEAGRAQREEAQRALAAVAQPLTFYGQLALEDLGQPLTPPPTPAAVQPTEREAARAHPGLQRALAMIAAGLRPEGVREWNFSLLGLNDRELLAAAQWACEREVWDRCINSSERSRTEIDLGQRYPTPLRQDVLARSREIGLDPAYVYGLIRQESRFIMDARSHVGASGLMQVMPATAKWTAKKIGMTDFRPEQITERDVNLRIGTAYLKLVLDDQGGAQALAAAAYNAGPSRPRRWRNGPELETAIWVENIPFNETRDYVKKVTANATVYAGLFSGRPASLKARLGATVGPRSAPPPTDPDLP